MDNKEASKSETFLGCGCLIFIVVIIALILHFFVFGKDDSKKSDTSSSKVATSKIASSSSVSSKKSDISSSKSESKKSDTDKEKSSSSETKKDNSLKTSVSEVSSIQKYNDALVVVMQKDKDNGIGFDLAGSKRMQKYILLQARKTMIDLRDNETAKKGGIVVVSYVKDDDGSYDTLMTLYASPSDLGFMSEVPGNPINFLKREITGYYVNGLYLHALMNDDKGIFQGMDLVSQDAEPRWVPEDVSTNMHSFINK